MCWLAGLAGNQRRITVGTVFSLSSLSFSCFKACDKAGCHARPFAAETDRAKGGAIL